MSKEYKLIGPIANVSNGEVKCTSCSGDGKRVQMGSAPDVCSTCEGTGTISGLMKQVNQAAAEGWEVSTHTMVGHPPINHLVMMEREVVKK